jgi:hypothetical protein
MNPRTGKVETTSALKEGGLARWRAGSRQAELKIEGSAETFPSIHSFFHSSEVSRLSLFKKHTVSPSICLDAEVQRTRQNYVFLNYILYFIMC